MSDCHYYQKFGINQSIFNSEPLKQLTPILKDSRSASDDIIIRKDSYGNVIMRGNKQHKIQFREQNEVFVVDNWKQYNTDMTNKESPCKLFTFQIKFKLINLESIQSYNLFFNGIKYVCFIQGIGFNIRLSFINYNYLNSILYILNQISRICLNKDDQVVNRKCNRILQKVIKCQTQSINNLKTQLQQQKQHRWSEQKMNKELFDFLSQINLQQYYGKIAQHCDGNLQSLINMKSTKDIKDLPFGYQIKLQKAIEKMSKETGNKISKIEQKLQNDQKECCWICFQLIFESIDCYGKKMCSEKCKQVYLKEIQVNKAQLTQDKLYEMWKSQKQI
ncbi:unnamed protein product [Paramecium primaurelia]|uniref:Uncharacterized protein n=1 Tax=Paramecium primaurelia TaxID=5886 RepID=A0A8S1PVX8_PARPR|nr:unnamed protein product [Paramecium primaurelia]